MGGTQRGAGQWWRTKLQGDCWPVAFAQGGESSILHWEIFILFLVQFRNLLLEFHWDFKAMTGHLETKVCMDNFDLNICCIKVGYMLICFGFFFGPFYFKCNSIFADFSVCKKCLFKQLSKVHWTQTKMSCQSSTCFTCVNRSRQGLHY